MSDDIAALQRSVELLTSEMRDLNRWLREEQAQRFARVEDTLGIQQTVLGDHASQIADIRVDIHQHRVEIDDLKQQVAAIEAAVKKG